MTVLAAIPTGSKKKSTVPPKKQIPAKKPAPTRGSAPRNLADAMMRKGA